VTDPTHPRLLSSLLAGGNDPIIGNGPVTTVVSSPDDRILATGTNDGTVRLWNVTDLTHPTPLGPPLANPTSPIITMVFSSDGHTLVTASNDGTVRRWKADTGQLINTVTITTLLPGERFSQMVFSSDRRTLATTSNDDTTTKLWNLDHQELSATLTGHTNLINAAAFSRDGGLLATISDDGTVRLWDLDPDWVTTRLCHIIGTPTEAEWKRLIPDLPYRPTCH
jgi:WD40 repeat protein